jgi:SAM-dependent methyltransferase
MEPGPDSRVDWDRSYLTRCAYNNDEKLATRQSIYAFAKPSKEPGFFGWGVSRIEWSGTEVVLDVGCGNGMWQKRLLQAMPGLRTMGMDLSEGMLRSFLAGWDGPRSAPVAVADAQCLPVRDRSVDVALLMHMLYHVPDRTAALSEARRVLRAEGGSALVTTLGRGHLHELREHLRTAICEVRGEDFDGPFLSNPFDARQAAAELPEVFSSVESYLRPDQLQITEVEPTVAWVDTQQGPDLDSLLPPSASWNDVLDTARQKAAAAIAEHGNFHVTTEVAVFLCRP